MKKHLLISTCLLLGLITPVAAQINSVPSVGLTTGYLPKATYSSAFFGLVPVVTSGTDQICISGSATKTVRVVRITIWGTTTQTPAPNFGQIRDTVTGSISTRGTAFDMRQLQFALKYIF